MRKFDWDRTRKSKNSWDFTHKTQFGSTKHLDFTNNKRIYKKDGRVTKTYPIKKSFW